MKNIVHCVIVTLSSGIGTSFIVSGVHQITGLYDYPAWRFDALRIGIGVMFIVGAILLYKNSISKL